MNHNAQESDRRHEELTGVKDRGQDCGKVNHPYGMVCWRGHHPSYPQYFDDWDRAPSENGEKASYLAKARIEWDG